MPTPDSGPNFLQYQTLSTSEFAWDEDCVYKTITVKKEPKMQGKEPGEIPKTEKPIVVPSWYKSDESQHWYELHSGQPAPTTIPGASGKPVKFTLKHARTCLEKGTAVYVPSVTSVLSILGNVGLDEWSRKEAVRFGQQNPSLSHDKAVEDFDKWRSQWADRGSYLHSLMYKSIMERRCPDVNNCICGIIDNIINRGMSPSSAEAPFVSREHLYGGKIDAVFSRGKEKVVYDWKFVKEKRPFYEKEIMQVSAYMIATGATSGMLVQINAQTRNVEDTYEISQEEAAYRFEVFLAIKRAWHLVKRYDISMHSSAPAINRSETECRDLLNKMYAAKYIHMNSDNLAHLLNEDLRRIAAPRG